MFNYFPSVAIFVILTIDLISILLFLMASKARTKQRVGGFLLLSIFIIPFYSLKLLQHVDFIASTPGKLTVTNGSKLYSPVYYMDNNGNIIWIFLAIKNIPVSKVFDIDGRPNGNLVIKMNGKYGYINFYYDKFSANIQLIESNLLFDRDGYLSNILSILFLLLILYHVLSYFIKRVLKRDTVKSIRED